MNVLGISEGFHDAGVCLLVGKKIHFASHSERYSRIKYDKWTHPNQYSECHKQGFLSLPHDFPDTLSVRSKVFSTL